jgi:parallel beta-helix repeat protein
VSDSNNGTSTATPWKHCPGDVNATGTPAATTPTGGDTLLFKGGVVYRGEITCLWSGASGSHIVFDGNIAGTWGTGRAIIDGSEEVTGWTQCTSAAEADGNPNWANIYWSYAPVGTTAFSADFFEDDSRLHPAQDPNLTNPYYFDELADYLEFDSFTTTTITDADYLNDPDPTYWDGSTYVYIHGGNNGIYSRPVTGYNPATHTITFEIFDSVFYTEYAMVNSLKILDVPGELVVREDQLDGSNRPKVYIWPLTPGVAGKTFDVSAERGNINLADESYITIRGFTLTKTTAEKAAIYNYVNQSVTDFLIDDNVIVHHAGSGVNIDDMHNCIVSNNEVEYCRGRGIILTDAWYTSIENNWIHNGGETAIDYYTAHSSQIVDNLVEDNMGLHANGITCYIYCEDILITRNKVSRGRAACTVGDCTNMTVSYNILDGNDILYTFADWRNQNGLYLYNNVITRGGTAISSTSVNVVAKNNIMAGSPVAYRGGISEYNIYTELSWTQTSGQLETGEFEATPEELWVDYANEDYHLKAGSPAINAGVNVGLTSDFEGNTVPQGGAVDVGAYERE